MLRSCLSSKLQIALDLENLLQCNGGKKEQMYSFIWKKEKEGHTCVSPGYLKGTKTQREQGIQTYLKEWQQGMQT